MPTSWPSASCNWAASRTSIRAAWRSAPHAEYVEGKTLKDMVTENLIAERIAIDSYREIITYLGNDDPTTRRIFEEILAQEEEHADDMADILDDLA